MRKPCPEIQAPAIAGAFLTCAPWIAQVAGASHEYGLVGAATAAVGAGSVTFAAKVRESPTLVSLSGVGAGAWGSWTCWTCWSDASTPARLTLGAFLTLASTAAGAVVRWRREGTPMEKARLERELARVDAVSAKAEVASTGGGETAWAELPSTVWQPPTRVPDTRDPIDVGGGVVIPLVGGHIIIGGCTGAGKSVFLADTIANLLPRRHLRITVIDPKGDALLGMLRNSTVIMGREENAEKIMAGHLATMSRRGSLVEAAADAYTLDPVGDPPPDDWEPTEEEPWDVIVVDEFTDFAGTDVMEMIVELARKSRALGQTLILATQSLEAALFKVASSPSGGGPRAQFSTRVAGRLDTPSESDKVFGEKMGKVWPAHLLPGKGHVLVRSESSREPVVRRVPYMDKATLAAWARRCSRPESPAGPAAPVRSEGGRHLSLVPTASAGTQADVVLGYLEANGESSVASISGGTGVSPGSLRSVLRRLAEQGCVTKKNSLWRCVSRTPTCDVTLSRCHAKPPDPGGSGGLSRCHARGSPCSSYAAVSTLIARRIDTLRPSIMSSSPMVTR